MPYCNHMATIDGQKQSVLLVSYPEDIKDGQLPLYHCPICGGTVKVFQKHKTMGELRRHISSLPCWSVALFSALPTDPVTDFGEPVKREDSRTYEMWRHGLLGLQATDHTGGA